MMQEARISQPGGLLSPGWFRIQSGEHEGRWHISGWMLSAIKGEATGPRSDGWLSFGICPVCNAMVVSDDKNAYGDRTWAHEQWHAGTDFPIPEAAERERPRTPRDVPG